MVINRSNLNLNGLSGGLVFHFASCPHNKLVFCLKRTKNPLII